MPQVELLDGTTSSSGAGDWTNLTNNDTGGSTDEWQAGVSYEIGDVVTYQVTEYECIQAHTSQVGWEPPNVPALWDAL